MRTLCVKTVILIAAHAALLMAGCASQPRYAAEYISMAFEVANSSGIATDKFRKAYDIPRDLTTRDEMAEYLFHKAIKLDAKGSAAYYNMAFYYLDGRDCQKARECLLNHLSYWPGEEESTALLHVIENEGCLAGRLSASGMDRDARERFLANHPELNFSDLTPCPPEAQVYGKEGERSSDYFIANLRGPHGGCNGCWCVAHEECHKVDNDMCHWSEACRPRLPFLVFAHGLNAQAVLENGRSVFVYVGDLVAPGVKIVDIIEGGVVVESTQDGQARRTIICSGQSLKIGLDDK